MDAIANFLNAFAHSAEYNQMSNYAQTNTTETVMLMLAVMIAIALASVALRKPRY